MSLKKIFLFTFLIPLILQSCSQNQQPPPTQITICPTNGAWCESTTNKNTISILLPKKIPYLKPFPIKVKFKSKDKIIIQKIQVQFSMQSMEMGINKFKLKRQTNNKQLWQTDVVLPICVTARKDWLVELDVKMNNSNIKSYFSLTIL